MKVPVQTQGEQDFAKFLEDLRGFVWNDSKQSHRNWAELAADAKLSPSTVHSFAMGWTQRPHFTTIYKLVKAMNVRLAVFAADVPLQPREIDLRQYAQFAGKRTKKK